jgi:RNA recognition motif-containing protein
MCVKLYIGNLPFGTTDPELQAHFSSHVTVTSAKVMADRFTGKSRGFGLMERPLKKKLNKRSTLYKGVFGGSTSVGNKARPFEETRLFRSAPSTTPSTQQHHSIFSSNVLQTGV